MQNLSLLPLNIPHDFSALNAAQRANLHPRECFCINFLVEIISYFMWKHWNGELDNVSRAVDAPNATNYRKDILANRWAE